MGSQDKAAEAEELLRESLAISRAMYGDENPLVAKTLFQLGTQLVRQGRRQEGEDLYRAALARQRKLLGEDHREVIQTLKWLAVSRYRARDYEENVALRRESLAIAERLYPDGHPEAFRRFGAMAGLGVALAVQAKVLLPTDRERALALFQEAEPLLSAPFTEMGEDPRSGSLEDKRLALERAVMIVEFFHNVAPDRGWGEQAAKLRTELEKLRAP
jgi:tetratricopeptide (TPR) repeat protein